LKTDSEEAKTNFKKTIAMFMEINQNNPFANSAQKSPELTLLNPVCFAKNQSEYMFFNSLLKHTEETPGATLGECLRGLAFLKRIV
jgi:hypothetical protein